MPHHPLTRRQWLAAAALLAASLGASAQAADSFASAQQTFARAQQGDTAAVDAAAAQFARLSAAAPADPVLLAYAGASEAMRATTTWMPWRKMRHAEDGLARLDKALSLATGAGSAPGPSGVAAVLETRFVAASTFLALPSMFNRQERGRALLAQVQTDPLFASAPAGFRQSVQQRAGAQ
ncbi:hypothetical protein KAK07_04910 [Ideonella sp. 4Y16]|uniref:Uncharacterized protein n=1 Tax=Ideonella alba TaxID=2824118 RepID=A0A941BN42_9BURK|nr:hypothetical protein [Ideonella alba]MBQ0932929.1 hypothetical protein [Ideonella alba]MBQ0942664.1 hypothetical protein [Ideonella alba]